MAKATEIEKTKPATPANVAKNTSAATAPPSEKDSKLRAFFIRAIWTIAMVAAFFSFILAGHFTLALLVYILQILAFREVINITGDPKYFDNVPWGRTISWYFLVVAMYFLNGEAVVHFFRNVGVLDNILTPLVNYHRFLTYALYMTGFVFFVCTLREGYYRQQFSHYCTTHMAIFLMIVQGHFIVENILHGIFWLLVPCGAVIVNDIAAYLCGITMGRTPLIKISPKKTVEGFVGAWILTVVSTIGITKLARRSLFLICPMERVGITYFTNVQCVPNPVFLPTAFHVPGFLQNLAGTDTLFISPIYFHMAVLATFASLIAPFGGFFASGFKRAFKVKDFGDTIPGHGGVTDRFDCQFIMGFFTHIYYETFVALPSTPDINQVLATAMALPHDEQLNLLGLLEKAMRPSI